MRTEVQVCQTKRIQACRRARARILFESGRYIYICSHSVGGVSGRRVKRRATRQPPELMPLRLSLLLLHLESVRRQRLEDAQPAARKVGHDGVGRGVATMIAILECTSRVTVGSSVQWL